MKLNFENLKKCLENIEWSLQMQSNGVNVGYIKNHKGEYTRFEVWFPETDGRIEYSKPDFCHPSVLFYFSDCKIKVLNNGRDFGIQAKNNPNVFILFSNHDLK